MKMHDNSNRLNEIDWNKSFNKYFKTKRFQFLFKDKNANLAKALQSHYIKQIAQHSTQEDHIPKIIHQIYSDKTELPLHYSYYAKNMQELHPDWEYKFWSLDKALKLCSIEVQSELQNLPNVLKIDVLKYKVLQEFGGIYIDCGIKFFSKFDELIIKKSFFASLLPPNKSKAIIISGQIIGSKKNHPIINEVLADLSLNNNMENYDTILTKVIKDRLEQQSLEDVLILPPQIFFPLNQDKEFKEPIARKRKFGLVNELMKPFSRLDPNTIATAIEGERYSYIRAQDFALLSGMEHVKEANCYTNHRDDVTIFENFKRAYLKLHPSKVAFSDVQRIPSNIHLIAASEDVCTKYQDIYKGWKIYNWSSTDLKARLKSRGLTNIEDPLIEKYIMSLLVLFESGGIYIDNDYIPIKDIKDFTYQYDFFAGLLPPNRKRLGVGLEIIGASLRHPVIEQTLDYIFDNFEYLNYIDCNNVFAYMISKAGLYNKNVVFPPVFFYPIAKQKLNRNLLCKIVQKLHGPDYVIDFTKLTPESHFIHKNQFNNLK